jgi:drug/metabolite transporter (DMT)-like permease
MTEEDKPGTGSEGQQGSAAVPPNNTRGILSMLLAMASFACGDSMMKLSGATVPTGELVFLRGILMLGAVTLIAWAMGAFKHAWRLLTPPMVTRGIGDVGGALAFQAALARMPFADLVAILQANPLLVTAASAIFLAERVGWRRWTATAIGFLGVLLIIRPGTSAFTWWSVLGLVSVFFSTLRDVSTKRVDRAVPTALILMVSSGIVTLGSLFLLPFETWVQPESQVMLQIVGSATFSLIGHMAVIMSVRSGDLSAIVPFRFSIVIWALILGYLLWGTLPDTWTIVGMGVVISAGLYTFHRELVVRRRMLQNPQSS